METLVYEALILFIEASYEDLCRYLKVSQLPGNTIADNDPLFDDLPEAVNRLLVTNHIVYLDEPQLYCIVSFNLIDDKDPRTYISHQIFEAIESYANEATLQNIFDYTEIMATNEDLKEILKKLIRLKCISVSDDTTPIFSIPNFLA